MQVPESDRRPLDESTDFVSATEHILDRAGGSLPHEAVILDEDVPAMPLIPVLRSEQPTYRTGRPGLSKYDRMQIIHASHIFETTQDRPLLEWCHHHGFPLVSCNVRDFVGLHQTTSHSGVLLCPDQTTVHGRPRAVAREIAAVISTRRKTEISDRVFTIDP